MFNTKDKFSHKVFNGKFTNLICGLLILFVLEILLCNNIFAEKPFKSADFALGGKEFSFRTWFLIKERQETGAIIIDNNHTATEGWAVNFDDKGTGIVFHIGDNSSKAIVLSKEVSFDTWHYVVCVNDGKNLRLFLDGKETSNMQGGNVVPRKGIALRSMYIDPKVRTLKKSTLLYKPFVADTALDFTTIAKTYSNRPDFNKIEKNYDFSSNEITFLPKGSKQEIKIFPN